MESFDLSIIIIITIVVIVVIDMIIVVIMKMKNSNHLTILQMPKAMTIRTSTDAIF